MSIWVLIALALVAFLLYVVSRPDSFRVQREILISAAPEQVFVCIDDLHNWANWSPWEKLDPGMGRTFGGPQTGVGANYAWDGNKKAGAGKMEITRSEPGVRIDMNIHFLRPFDAHNFIEFLFNEEGVGTRVTWSIYGPSPFISKLMGIFINMDKMIGKDFEAGLISLKQVAEARPGLA